LTFMQFNAVLRTQNIYSFCLKQALLWKLNLLCLLEWPQVVAH